jgi:hypothetical protein
MFEFYAFSYTDNLTFKEENTVYEKLQALEILRPSYNKATTYQYVKKGEIPKSFLINNEGNHSFESEFYLHPEFTEESIPYGITLPAPKKELRIVLPVFNVLLNEKVGKYGYGGVEEVWSIADKI